MRASAFSLSLPASSALPLVAQVAHAIVHDVRRGRLRPGDVLPSSRALARALGVHRNTVLAAFDELRAEGWITTARARYTAVSDALPEPRPRRAAAHGRADSTGFSLPPARVRARVVPVLAPGALSMSGGVPDTRLVPTSALARAVRRALTSPRHGLLGYGASSGVDALRTQIAALVSSKRALPATRDNVLVTRGSQMALDLVARVLLRPGDVVVVENPGYRPAWDAFRAAGADVACVDVDADGIDVDAVARVVAHGGVRAVYVTPHHQYPTTCVLSAARRLRLLALARAHRFAVIEDDYDHEFHYEGRPVLPIASADDSGNVIYVGTFSKVLAPALRTGYVVAPSPLIDALVRTRAAIDVHGDAVWETALAELLEDGELQRHVLRARRAYLARRDVLLACLRDAFGDRVQVRTPAGGVALWVGTGDVDADAWAAAALQHKLLVQPGSAFHANERNVPFLRLGYARLTPEEIAQAVRRLALAYADVAASATTAARRRRRRRAAS